MDQLELFRNFGNPHRLKHTDMLQIWSHVPQQVLPGYFPTFLGKIYWARDPREGAIGDWSRLQWTGRGKGTEEMRWCWLGMILRRQMQKNSNVFFIDPHGEITFCIWPIHSVEPWAANKQCVGMVPCSWVPQGSCSVDSNPQLSDHRDDLPTELSRP